MVLFLIGLVVLKSKIGAGVARMGVVKRTIWAMGTGTAMRNWDGGGGRP